MMLSESSFLEVKLSIDALTSTTPEGETIGRQDGTGARILCRGLKCSEKIKLTYHCFTRRAHAPSLRDASRTRKK